MTAGNRAGFELRVPGRLCLFGEHSDWAGQYRGQQPEIYPGYCIVTGTDQSIPARASRHPDSILVSSEIDGSSIRVPAQAAALADAARSSELLGYVLGVASIIVADFDVAGLRLDIEATELPVRKGLSSSAAVCVLMARAFSEVYDLGLSVEQEMELAYRGERLMGSECGRMDQVCAFGKQLSFLEFRGESITIDSITVPEEVPLLVVDLDRAKNTRRILQDLNSCYPARHGKLADNVRSALGPLNADLVERARNALAEGDAMAVGALMTEAQRIFDDHVAPASSELDAPFLHELLEWAATTDLTWGGKGVGSQGDGCAQFVARSAQARVELAERLGELGLTSLEVTLGGRGEA